MILINFSLSSTSDLHIPYIGEICRIGSAYEGEEATTTGIGTPKGKHLKKGRRKEFYMLERGLNRAS